MSLTSLTPLSVNGTPTDALPRDAGIHDVTLQLPDQGKARFTLALPRDGVTRDAPLVLVLHYAGQPTPFYGRPLIENLFGPAWSELDAVFVAPESRGGQWSTPDNETLVLHLLDSLVEAYAIDRRRIVIGGYSMGAIGSWYFAEQYPERFSAVVPIAGISRGDFTCALPVHVLATPSDEVFDYQLIEQTVNKLAEAGCAVELTQVPARGHYDVGGFREALAALLPWLREVWQQAE